MKKLITLFLLFLPLLSISQEIMLSDTTYEIRLTHPNYDGTYMNGGSIDVLAPTVSRSALSFDTIGGTMSFTQTSFDGMDSVSFHLIVTSVTSGDNIGVTYNFYDHMSGSDGFLYMNNSGLVMLVIEVESGIYGGLIGFIVT